MGDARATVPNAARDELAEARAALERGEWAAALERFLACDDGRLTPADLDRLGEAAVWTGRLTECVVAWERAVAAHLEQGDRVAAARTALRLVREYVAKNERAVAAGWYQRAKRLLADVPEDAAHGYLADAEWFAAMDRGDFDAACAHGERMADFGARFDDPNLLALGLNRQGHALVSQGRVEEGLALLDEATAAAVSGELDTSTTFIVYCATVSVCRDLTDYRRAGEWAQAGRRWCERASLTGFPGLCRIYTAELLRLRGAWREAEDDARQACEELEGMGARRLAGAGFVEMGEIRLRLGDLAGAEEAFCTAHELGRNPHPGLALVRLAQGRREDAAVALGAALDERPDDRLARARLLPALVEVAVAAGDVDRARAAADELTAIAADYGTLALRGHAATARAAIALAGGAARTAVSDAREGLRCWQELELPYEEARTRMILAGALDAEGNRDGAALEQRAARTAFVKLGAARDAAAADSLLEAADRAARAAPVAADRTFMFTDVVGSTDLIAAVGDQAWVDARAWHDAALRAAFATHSGEEVNHAGDGFFVAFPSADAAIDCAVAVQCRLERHRREHGFALPVRIGVHAAQAAATPDGYAGRGVHAAARIGALAGAGEILVSRDTLEQARPGIPAGAVRQVALKGLPDEMEIAPVDWQAMAG